MLLLPEDERGLLHALTLAREAAAFASPNPTVGCVLTRGVETLGEGAHFYDNRDHAEIAALKQAAESDHSARGATAYVTLEPCAHHGRTGPCADALIAAGIARCVVATLDPNPQVRGKGLEKLRAAGVEVLVAEPSSHLAQTARRLNDAFAFSIQHHRPFVTLKAAVSLDGYLAPPPGTRSSKEPHWLTGPSARADVQRLRHASDAVLTGIGTVLADNPSFTDRTGLPRRRPLLRVILDSQLRTPLNSALVAEVADDLLLITSINASAEVEAGLRSLDAAVARVPMTGTTGALDLRAVLHQLHERGIRSVLLEAGSALNGSFLAADLVDRVVLYFSESELGKGAVPFAAGQPSPYALQARLSAPARVAFAYAAGSASEDIRISGYLHDPWEGVSELFPVPCSLYP